MSTAAVQTNIAISPEVPWDIAVHLQEIYRQLGNHTQAFSLIKQAATAAGNTVNNFAEVINSGGGSTPTATGITVNNQSGQTSYATVAGDNLALIVFSDASPVAVSLTGQAPPWACFATNLGAGTVTFTPASGTINGGATFTLPFNYTSLIAFDGTNWFASAAQLSIADIAGLSAALALLAPLDSPALTGTPTAPTATPLTDDTQIATTAYADAAVAMETTRAEAAEALLAPLASPTFTGAVTQPDSTVLTAATTATNATAGAASALPATPAGYLEASINGTTVKIPYYSV